MIRPESIRPHGLAILEITALGAALVILDRIEKAAPVRLVQAELNDFSGFLLKMAGSPAALRAAVELAEQLAGQMQARCVTAILDAPDERALKGIGSAREFSPLIEQNVVFDLDNPSNSHEADRTPMATENSFAIGLIETQGFTAVIEAIDTACKAANVEVLGKEKLGGGYITILIKGDVAAVNAAIEAGKSRVDGLGKLIAAHVIARPSAAILALLPK